MQSKDIKCDILLHLHLDLSFLDTCARYSALARQKNGKKIIQRLVDFDGLSHKLWLLFPEEANDKMKQCYVMAKYAKRHFFKEVAHNNMSVKDAE